MERCDRPQQRPVRPVQLAKRIASVRSRERWVITGVAVAVTALAWAWLWPMRGMTSPGGSWSAAEGFVTFAMWVVMMAAMMVGPAVPALALYAAMQRSRPSSRYAVPLFASGYAATWIVFSALATLAQWLLDRAEALSSAMATTSHRVGGAILVLAGLYAWTPLHHACLRHCQSPLGFFMTHWRDGAVGAVRMGIDHGVYCVGCCWALMAILFAVGVMNLAWVALLTLVVLLLKVSPTAPVISRIVGAVLVVLGVATALAPA